MSDAPNEKYDEQDLDKNGTYIPDMPFWSKNVPFPNHNGCIFPQPEIAKRNNIKWQIQIWSLYSNTYLLNQVDFILNNSMSKGWRKLHDIDLAFWSHGLHDYGWFNTPPYARKYYDQVLKKWLDVRLKYAVPSVWIPMNNECDDRLEYRLSKQKDQHRIVEECNTYTNHKALKHKFPYWDAAAVLRSPERCNISADGVQVKMFVDIMRAKMLFNHLCDEEMNWRANINVFL